MVTYRTLFEEARQQGSEVRSSACASVTKHVVNPVARALGTVNAAAKAVVAATFVTATRTAGRFIGFVTKH